MKRSDYNEKELIKSGLATDSSSKTIQQKGNHISRRSFTKSISHIVGLGVLGHFSLLANNLQAEEITNSDDECGSGLDIDDICNPPDNNDNCPGELPPADFCPFDGNRAEDDCATGLQSADSCVEGIDPESDQCATAIHVDDACASKNHPDDKCYSGTPEQDDCPPDGGLSPDETDQCYGGGSTAPDGQTLDTCTKEGEGDECPGSLFFGEDDCKSEHPDECTYTDDDTCLGGTDTADGNGFSDSCIPEGILGMSFSSDLCAGSGIPEEDNCTDGSAYGINNGLNDECPGGGTAVDVCDPAVQSDDYCLGGNPNSDECTPVDEDECPGGHSNVDDCLLGLPPEDVCTAEGGCAGGDQEGVFPLVDECLNQQTDACTVAEPDNAE